MERKQKIVEGELRCQELSDYLDKLNAPRKVWLSEDASGIVSKVVYDSTTNQLVGLVLPLDKRTGLPITYSFTPHSMSDIEKQIQGYAKSTLVYIVIAQPLMDTVPPFILLVFGTDNKFKSLDVMQRWKHVKDSLAK